MTPELTSSLGTLCRPLPDGTEMPGPMPPAEYAPLSAADMLPGAIDFIRSCDRGKAGGPSGWTYDDLKSLLKHGGERAETPLATLLAHTANVRFSDPGVWELLTAGTLVLLRKPDGAGCRPISTQEVFLNVAAAAQKATVDVKTTISAFESATGMPGGVEGEIHAIRALCTAHPDDVVWSRDAKAAYPSLSVPKALQVMREEYPQLYPLLHACLARPSTMTHTGRDGTRTTLIRHDGLNQGFVDSTLVYCTTQARALDPLVAEYEGRVRIFSTADDVVLCGSPPDVLECNARVTEELALIGITANERKTAVYRPAGFDDEVGVQLRQAIPDGATVSSEGIKLVGGALGIREFEAAHCTGVVATALQTAQKAVRWQQDLARAGKQALQATVTAMRQCSSTRFTFHARTHPPSATEAPAEEFDDGPASLMRELYTAPLTGDAADDALFDRRLRLPTRLGGEGLVNYVGIGDAAFYGSFALPAARLAVTVGDVVTDEPAQDADGGNQRRFNLATVPELNAVEQRLLAIPKVAKAPSGGSLATSYTTAKAGVQHDVAAVSRSWLRVPSGRTCPQREPRGI